MPQRVYQLMFNAGEVVEIRGIGGLKGHNKAWEGACFGAKGTVSGYFNNAEDFGKGAKALDGAGAHGVYFTLNPCLPSLLARAENRLKANINNTTDKEVLCIRWLPIDLDPVRPSGISSTKEELQRAVEVAKTIAGHLEAERGWAKAVRGFSGNGYHMLYRLQDPPNEPSQVVMVRKALAYLDHKFSTEEVKVDTSVYNPARIWKVYGTHARKGDNTKDRPHRLSRLLTKQKTLSDVGASE